MAQIQPILTVSKSAFPTVDLTIFTERQLKFYRAYLKALHEQMDANPENFRYSKDKASNVAFKIARGMTGGKTVSLGPLAKEVLAQVGAPITGTGAAAWMQGRI